MATDGRPAVARRCTIIFRIVDVLCDVFLFLIHAIVMIFLLVFLYFVVLPFAPQICNESAFIHPYNITTPSILSTRWYLKLFIRNPSRSIPVKYNRLVAVVYYHDKPLASMLFPAFGLGPKNATTVEASFSVTLSNYLGNEWWLVDDLSTELGRGEVNVRVMLLVEFTLWLGGLPVEHTIEFHSHVKFKISPKPCRLDDGRERGNDVAPLNKISKKN